MISIKLRGRSNVHVGAALIYHCCRTRNQVQQATHTSAALLIVALLLRLTVAFRVSGGEAEAGDAQDGVRRGGGGPAPPGLLVHIYT